ncbi:hypothetical protein AAFC00_001588 [Neodothiora populina]|uniref:GH64 domain-containing protein n=1 Tax=Neodothiora populina TaxID=2781224 RepID=A0ABR3PPF4_9PEZI
MKVLAWTVSALIGLATASPMQVTPGGPEDIIITEENTLNATTIATFAPVRILAASGGQLPLALVNNLASSNVHAYVTGLDPNGQLVMLKPDGSWYYPTSTSSGIPVAITENVAIPLGAEGTTKTITLPGYISSGRVYFADGTLKFYTVQAATGATSLVEPSAVNPSDPSANVNWGFIELTNTAAGGIYVNLSFVDFVGLPLGITLTDTSGGKNEARGLVTDAVEQICSELTQQAKTDGQPWDELCMYSSNGQPLRALSPYNYLAGLSNSAFSSYWTSYIDQVWAYYTRNKLTINTQAAAGLVSCSVTSGVLYCDGDNRGYAKPTASDIFGCNAGPFAIQGGDNSVHYAVVPRLCAAFHRSTFLIAGGSTQPAVSSSRYYLADPTNWYSSIVHDFQIDGRGYAFPYDDVTPTGGQDTSGLLATTQPKLLTVYIGGDC